MRRCKRPANGPAMAAMVVPSSGAMPCIFSKSAFMPASRPAVSCSQILRTIVAAMGGWIMPEEGIGVRCRCPRHRARENTPHPAGGKRICGTIPSSHWPVNNSLDLSPGAVEVELGEIQARQSRCPSSTGMGTALRSGWCSRRGHWQSGYCAPRGSGFVCWFICVIL